MKKVCDVMVSSFPVAPGSVSVRNALALMREHGVEAIPVVDDGVLLGMVSSSQLSDYHPNRLLYDVRMDIPVVARQEMSLAAAYDLIEGSRARHLPVVSDGELVGIVSLGAIQTNLAISADPLTGLPWADSLRERAISCLSQGQEVVILFMDIDSFRLFNKEYGHVIGDHVIVGVAQALVECTDPEFDLVCRYAGDEFAIVTTRVLEEAEELAQRIGKRVCEVHVDGIDTQISVSIGIRGGRRTKEREGIHFAATVDDLINLASKASTLAKPGAAPKANEPAPTPEPLSPPAAQPVASSVRVSTSGRPAIVGFKLRSSGRRFEVEVQLARGDQSCVGTASGVASAQTAMRLAMQATLDAASPFLPEGSLLAPDAVEQVRLGEDRSIMAVVVTFADSRGHRTLAGAAAVEEDPYRTVVEATLNAINRVLL